MKVKTSAPDCPFCEAQNWIDGSHQVELSHQNLPLTVSGLMHSECAECGYELVLPHQIRRNDACIRDARRIASGMLTGSRIRAIRKKLGLSQQHMAALIGCGKNAFSKYERGEVTQSAAMDKLLRILDASPEALNILEIQGRACTSRTPIYESDALPSIVLTESKQTFAFCREKTRLRQFERAA